MSFGCRRDDKIFRGDIWVADGDKVGGTLGIAASALDSRDRQLTIKSHNDTTFMFMMTEI